MFTNHNDKQAQRYPLLSKTVLLVALFLGMALMGSMAYAASSAQAKGSNPSSPTSSVLCVNATGGATGAPCANANGYTNLNSAIAAASAGDEIRIARGAATNSGTYSYTITLDKPLTLYGGFSGNTNDWGAPNCTDPECTILNGELVRNTLVVQGNITVSLNDLSMLDGSVVNDSGTINVVGYGIELRSQTDTNAPTINGHYNIVAPGHLRMISGTWVEQAGTNITGDGYVWLEQSGRLDISGNTSISNLRDAVSVGSTRSGYITGNATLNITHDFVWQSNVMTGTGVTNIQPGATMEFTPIDANGGGDFVLDTRTVNNLGTATWEENGYGLSLDNGATFNNTGTFNLIQNQNFVLNNDNGTTGTFNNGGVLRLVAGSGSVQLLKHSESVTFNNTGNIDIPGAGDTLNFLQGTINMNAGSTITGAGTASVGDQSGAWNITAPTSVQNVALLGGGPARVTGPSTLTVLGHLDWSGYLSTMGGTGATNIAAGATVTLHDYPSIDGRTLNNAGTITLGNNVQLAMSNNAVVNNSGVFSATTQIWLRNNSTPATFNNSGTFYISDASDNFADYSLVFNNSGLFDIRSGRMFFTHGGTYNQTAGITRIITSGMASDAAAPLNFQGGQLQGNGSITGNVSNTGAVVKPGDPLGNGIGVLTIDGNYTQGAGGALSVDLGGHTAGTQYDQLSVTGVASLAGALNTTTVSGFAPQVGDQFQVLLYASHTGAFGAINGSNGAQYTAHYNPTDLTLAMTGTSGCNGFTDVTSGSPFYPFVACLVNRGVISGYSDCTFRPSNNVTRGQLSKIVALAAGYTDPPGAQTFQDIAPASPFYTYIQQLSSRGVIGGYTCGGAGEPCVAPGNLPYFRPNGTASRGQTSKIVAIAKGLPAPPAIQQTFQDVPHSSPFWQWIEALSTQGAISGYQCGGAGEPCVAPGNKPYFRPSGLVTRGQSSKIVANTFFPGCQTPARK